MFQDSNVFETELSYFHLLTVNEFKMGFQKVQPKIVNYRDYKNFGNKKFRPDISKFDFGISDLGKMKLSQPMNVLSNMSKMMELSC